MQHVQPHFLRAFIPFLLIAIAVYLLFRASLGEADAPARWKAGAFHLVWGSALGFYDGFFGPGTGSFWAMAYVVLLGFNLTKATAHTKLMNFTSNAASLAMFIIGGKVFWLAGLTMGLGELLGARLGAKIVIRRGARFVRPIFVAVALAIAVRLVITAVAH